MADFPPPSPVTGATFSREASLDCAPPDTPASAWTPIYGFNRSLSRDSVPGDRKRSVDSIKSLEAVKDIDESELKSSRDSSFDSQKDAPIPAVRGQLQKQASEEGKNEGNSKNNDKVTSGNGSMPKLHPRIGSIEESVDVKSDTNAKEESPEKSSMGKKVRVKPPRQSSMESTGLLTKQGSIETKTMPDKPTRQGSKDQEKSAAQPPQPQPQPRPPSPKKKLPPPVAKKPTRPVSNSAQSKDISKAAIQHEGESKGIKSPTGPSQGFLKSPTDPSNRPVPPAVLPKPKISKPADWTTATDTNPNIAETAEKSPETNKNVIGEAPSSPPDKEEEVSKGESGEEKKDSPEKEKPGSDVTTGRDSSSSKEAAVTNQCSALTASTEVIVYKLVTNPTTQPAFQFINSVVSVSSSSVYICVIVFSLQK